MTVAAATVVEVHSHLSDLDNIYVYGMVIIINYWQAANLQLQVYLVHPAFVQRCHVTNFIAANALMGCFVNNQVVEIVVSSVEYSSRP